MKTYITIGIVIFFMLIFMGCEKEASSWAYIDRLRIGDTLYVDSAKYGFYKLEIKSSNHINTVYRAHTTFITVGTKDNVINAIWSK